MFCLRLLNHFVWDSQTVMTKCIKKARWWPSKYKENGPLLWKGSFFNCSVHSYVYDLLY